MIRSGSKLKPFLLLNNASCSVIFTYLEIQQKIPFVSNVRRERNGSQFLYQSFSICFQDSIMASRKPVE